MESLAAVQRRLWRLITAPEGAGAALAAEGDPEGRSLGWIVSDEKRDAIGRIEIYANAYFQRIHDCLAEDFDVLAACVGPAGFHDLVTAYLIAHPSEHPSLRDAGARLPDYLATATPAAPFRARWPWAADVTRLEWALGAAFDAADAAPLGRDALGRLAPEAWEALAFDFHPSAGLIDTTWPVHETVTALRAGEPVVPPEAPRASTTLVWRRDETVRYRALDADEAALLRAARAGDPFGALCALAAENVGDERAPEQAAAALSRWIEGGAIVAARTA